MPLAEESDAAVRVASDALLSIVKEPVNVVNPERSKAVNPLFEISFNSF